MQTKNLISSNYQQVCLKISNIHFNINKPKNTKKKFQTHMRRVSMPNAKTTKTVPIQIQAQSKQKQKELFLQNQSITLLRSTSFIPRNSNVKNSLFFVEKVPKRIQSLESAKLQQRRFPMRKILTRRSIIGYSFFKQKKFSFGNPETQPVFENKHILQSLSKSQTDFKSSSRLQSGTSNRNNFLQSASRMNMRYSQASQRLRYNQKKSREQHPLLLKLDFN